MITLKKDGIYRFRHIEETIGEDVSGHICNEIKVHSFLPYLNETMEVEDVTFEDFFDHIMRQKGKYSSIFASHLGNYKLQQWEEEWNRIPTDTSRDTSRDTDDYEMTSVEICWYGESWHYEGEDLITIEPDFHGVGFAIDTKKQMGMGVDFTPINDLKLYPFELNEQLNVYSLQDSKILLSGKKEFTVYEVISTVLDEITFFGSPEQRNKKINEIKQTCEDIKSGKEKTISRDDFLSNLKKKTS